MSTKIDIKKRRVQYMMIAVAMIAGIIIIGYALPNNESYHIKEDVIGNGTVNFKMEGNLSGENFKTFGPMTNSSELRFITVGDVQGKDKETKLVVDFINNIPGDKVNFTVFLGDYINVDTVDAIKDNMQKPYYVVEGNHDKGHFYDYWSIDPSQYNKSVNGFQVVIPAFDWKSYNWSQVDKTVPTIVFNHGPVLPNCGSDDSLHKYAFDMKEELDKLNMLAFYNGHTHTYQKDIIDGRLYVAEDALSSGDRGTCDDGPSKYVGYTRIEDNGTVSYTRLDFSKQFVDPFP